MDLNERFNNYFDNILSKLDIVCDEKERYLLYSDLDRIKDIAFNLGLNISFPKGVYNICGDFSNDNNEFWDNFYSMKATNNKIAYLANVLPNNNFDYKTLEKDTDELFLLTLDFFKHFDKDIANHLEYIFDNGFVYMCNMEDYGQTFHLYSQKCSYILLDGSFSDVILASTLVHETIHSYISKFVCDISYQERLRMNINGLNEVYSHFSEFAFLNFLKTINYDNEGIYSLECSLNNLLISHLKEFNNNFNNFDNVNIFDYSLSELDAYGILLALHYFYKYLDNPAITKNDVFNLTVDSKKYDKHVLLNNYGLNEYEIGQDNVLLKHFNK